ncbi:MAG: carboxypeptidase regulatory-like domain-containing protein [Anaerolineales bacterium]|nr:carboxypeptidase regulatory-like domain-containing protein [Anaerolineales bacterium]
MKTKSFLILVVWLAMIVVSCGPSPEQVATMTASAWTPTPKPTSTPTATPTSTPIPYDLTVRVTDADGNPLNGASVLLDGEENPLLTGETGEAAWTNLSAPDSSVTIAASGYFASDQSFSLSRGPNEVIVSLERDPNGLLASQACAPGETVLYIEDFQDGHAQGLDVVEFKAGGWSIGAAPDLAENSVMTLALPDSYRGRVTDNEQAQLTGQAFENGVWRFRILVTGPGTYIFYWQTVEQPYQTSLGEARSSRYMIHLGTKYGGRGDRASALVRQQPPLSDFIIADRAVEYLKSKTWYFVEISTFDGNTKVWLDGKEIMDYMDPQPMPAGSFGIAADLVSAGAVAYYDNMSVCGMSAPFVSLYTAP